MPSLAPGIRIFATPAPRSDQIGSDHNINSPKFVKALDGRHCRERNAPARRYSGVTRIAVCSFICSAAPSPGVPEIVFPLVRRAMLGLLFVIGGGRFAADVLAVIVSVATRWACVTCLTRVFPQVGLRKKNAKSPQPCSRGSFVTSLATSHDQLHVRAATADRWTQPAIPGRCPASARRALTRRTACR